ncbi:MAG: hypothetical protein OXD32_03015 [Endozoicomonadaceae bacterium]|nr:hypothetical protein [Endozoicomonadaceae bacterium]
MANKWYSVNPLPDHWIVNFGCAMEIFTRFLSNPVRAVPHRVKRQCNDKRSSYALFIDSTMNKQLSNCLYEYVPQEGLKKFANLDEFLVDIVANIYTKDGVGLY